MGFRELGALLGRASPSKCSSPSDARAPGARLAWGMRIKDPGSHCLFPRRKTVWALLRLRFGYKQKMSQLPIPRPYALLPQQGLKPAIPGHSTHTMREVCCWWGLYPQLMPGKPPAFQNLPEKKSLCKNMAPISTALILCLSTTSRKKKKETRGHMVPLGRPGGSYSDMGVWVERTRISAELQTD